MEKIKGKNQYSDDQYEADEEIQQTTQKFLKRLKNISSGNSSLA